MGFSSPGEWISKWSQVDIDADKSWQDFGTMDLKELVATMTKGDMIFFDGTRLVRISPGSIGMCLIAHDWGNDPTWGYPP